MRIVNLKPPILKASPPLNRIMKLAYVSAKTKRLESNEEEKDDSLALLAVVFFIITQYQIGPSNVVNKIPTQNKSKTLLSRIN